MKIFILSIILSISTSTCSKKSDYQEETDYLNRYFEKINHTKMTDNQLVFVMKPDACMTCSNESMVFIQQVFQAYDTPQTFIINGHKKIDFLKVQIQQLPNSTIIIDSTYQIDRYGFLHVNDALIEVENGQITFMESITDDTFKKLKRRYKR